jgi:hypothetical protein
MDQLADAIERSVNLHLKGRSVKRLVDRGVWERQIVEVTLDGDEVVFFKIQLTDWDMTGFEVKGVQLFQEHGLPTWICSLPSKPWLPFIQRLILGLQTRFKL